MYEIERKFLVKEEELNKVCLGVGKDIKQCYIFDTELGTLRARQHGKDYILNIKLREAGFTQIEIEKPLTELEFTTLWDKSILRIGKRRYKYDRWEIDFFQDNFILAEIELESEDEDIEIPSFCGEEVTGNPKYFNSNMAKRKNNEKSNK